MARGEAQANADLERGRACYEQRRWADAVEALRDAQQSISLSRDDLARLAWAGALAGDDDTFLPTLERLYHACTRAGDGRGAARAAFWAGFRLFALGATGRASGWLSRAERCLQGESEDCPERGYLLVPAIFGHLARGEQQAAKTTAEEAAGIGERCHEPDLVAMARNLEGRALLQLGYVDTGLALLDEVMLTVTAGGLSPLVTGIVYCNVLTTCQQVYAYDRAREWTAALQEWCARQPQLVAFTGSCLVHRSEVMQLGGDWRQAYEEVRKIRDHVCQDDDPDVLADACYQEGELLRVRGDLTEAEASYELAARHGRDPQPGLALLRLAQGRPEEAVSAIERALSATTQKWRRAHFLPACVEIRLAAGDVEPARSAAEELTVLADDSGVPILGGMAAHARGAVCLAGNDPRGALEPLLHAFSVWKHVGAPYIAARVRVLIAEAYTALGDNDSAALELEAARDVFGRLGAEPDLSRLPPATAPARSPAHGLSRREMEVLRLVAAGRTNKAIANELCISERTVDRHVSNILAKTGVRSRTAATAFAYRNNLL